MKTSVKQGDKVSVYWNLHKKMYSVGYYTTGKLICHVKSIALENAKLVVQPAGNQRVRDEKRKNVHAFIKGTVACFRSVAKAREVYYNPYKHKSFVFRDTEEEIKELDYIDFVTRVENNENKTSLHTI